jgi:hypothetical protein
MAAHPNSHKSDTPLSGAALGTLMLAACVFFCHGPIGSAQPPAVVETQGPATLRVDGMMDKAGISRELSDVLTITLEVDGSKTLEVKPPDKITSSPGWRLVVVSPATIVKLDKEHLRWRQIFTFEPLSPGALVLHIEPLLFREHGGPYQKIAWKALAVRVGTRIASPDVANLRDPTVIEPLPPPAEARIIPWLWAGSAVAAVFFLALSLVWWRRRSRPRANLAEQWALRELGRTLALRLPDQGKVERFHTLLANVVRRYLERKYQLPARRRTTPEFLDVLQSCQKLSGPNQAFLREFFTRCDLAKFAGAHVSSTECLALAEEVRALVRGQSSSSK